MEHDIASWLADIKQAIDEMNEFLPDKKFSSNFKMI
jgi:hypothetical protein